MQEKFLPESNPLEMLEESFDEFSRRSASWARGQGFIPPSLEKKVGLNQGHEEIEFLSPTSRSFFYFGEASFWAESAYKSHRYLQSKHPKKQSRKWAGRGGLSAPRTIDNFGWNIEGWRRLCFALKNGWQRKRLSSKKMSSPISLFSPSFSTSLFW